MDGDPPLTPTQQEVLDLLGATPGQRPAFDLELAAELEDLLATGLLPLARSIPDDDTLFVSKHQLGQVHACEARYLAEEAEEFEWSVPLARGTVAHKAIELSVHWRGPLHPLTLVDEALGRLENDSSGIGHWLQGTAEAERAELRGEANDRVAAFLECWPPLKRSWRPVTESRVRSELCGGKIVLSGKVDLSLGQPHGLVAGKVLVDLKTGGGSPVHRDDLRFYALLETLRVGTPPRLLATFYLDRGRFETEQVTEGVLEASVHRVVAGVARIIELHHDRREPVRRPGPSCRWCPVSADCEPGTRYLSADDDLDLGEDWEG
ncbi:MAG: PD-(D/E)XK nuclease family protein [Acidimicrobiales bacterium]|nr:PD-(D/E)XK nuclease family protein [Acidimicrobiales bacterium]